MKLFYYNMSTLLYAITTITLTNAAAPATYSPTPLFPTPSNGSIIPITGATGFQCIVSVHVSIWTSIYKLHNQKNKVCTKLNLAGCGTNTLNPFIRSYVNNEIQILGYNYSLPLDPCDFDTINMSW
eukprot:401718_1